MNQVHQVNPDQTFHPAWVISFYCSACTPGGSKLHCLRRDQECTMRPFRPWTPEAWWLRPSLWGLSGVLNAHIQCQASLLS